MLGAAAIVAQIGVAHFSFDWPLFVSFAAVLGLGGIGIAQRSLVPQVLSRAAAWIVLFPAMILSLVHLLEGRAPSIEIAGLAATTGAALLLARPMLHTRDAREQFGPKAFRHSLLAGSTATAAMGFIAGGIGLATLGEVPLTGAALGVLAASLFASSLAVVRMRSWGIFLGGLTSAVLVAIGAILGPGALFVLSLAAAPALLLHVLPVLVARWRDEPAAPKLRVMDDLAAEPVATAHYRIAEGGLADVDDDAAATKPGPAALRA